MPLFIRLEQAAFPEEVQRIVAECAVRLAGPEYAGLNHAIAAWVSYTVLQRDGFATEKQLKAIDSLQGVNSFMESNIQKWIAKHEAVGEARGEARGEVKTLRRLLVKGLQKRLGDVPETFQILIANAVSPDLLESLLEQASEAEDLRALLPSMEKALRSAACGQGA